MKVVGGKCDWGGWRTNPPVGATHRPAGSWSAGTWMILSGATLKDGSSASGLVGAGQTLDRNPHPQVRDRRWWGDVEGNVYVVLLARLRRPYGAWIFGLALIPGFRSSASGTRSHYAPGYNCAARTGLRPSGEWRISLCRLAPPPAPVYNSGCQTLLFATSACPQAGRETGGN